MRSNQTPLQPQAESVAPESTYVPQRSLGTLRPNGVRAFVRSAAASGVRPPMRRRLRRRPAVDRCKRGNQASGTLTSRPSASVVTAVSVTATSVTSCLSSIAEVLVERFLIRRLMLLHQAERCGELV